MRKPFEMFLGLGHHLNKVDEKHGESRAFSMLDKREINHVSHNVLFALDD
jgi:hypothetical protein